MPGKYRARVKQLIKMLGSIGKRQSFSLNGLDVKLQPYINFKDGFFVEAGANDGLRQSNTLYFEKYLGWKGLLIEPIPELAKQCQKNRPKCIVENCALVAADYPEKTVQMHYFGLMSIVDGALGNPERETEHMQKGTQHMREGEQMYSLEVPAVTLSGVLDRHQVENIDLLSLDVEGYEPQVLLGLDFERHQPKFMLIEVRSREDIEAIIGRYYTPVAVLSTSSTYSDILYQRRSQATEL